MILSDTGEARVRGYLFVLERSLRAFLPPAVALDAVREVESHIRERALQAEAVPDERTALEALLYHLGSPMRVAQAYSLEMAVDEAVATGTLRAVGRALWQLATTTIGGFMASLGLFAGYMISLGFFLIAALKPVMPNNTGFIFVDGKFRGFGMQTGLPPTAEVRGGYWIIPLCLVLGLGLLVITHRLARRVLTWWRSRPGWRRGVEMSLKIRATE